MLNDKFLKTTSVAIENNQKKIFCLLKRYKCQTKEGSNHNNEIPHVKCFNGMYILWRAILIK